MAVLVKSAARKKTVLYMMDVMEAGRWGMASDGYLFEKLWEAGLIEDESTLCRGPPALFVVGLGSPVESTSGKGRR
jgi:hypothetical protein